MKKIVFYTDATGFGGAEEMMLALAEGLDRKRWRPVLAYHETGDVERIARRARESSIETVPFRPLSDDTHRKDVVHLARSLRALHADVFHAHLSWALRCTSGIEAAWLARIPVRVASQQLLVLRSSRRGQVRQRLVSMLLHRYIAVSQGVAAALRRSGVPARKLRVVYNSVDISRFEQAHGDAMRRSLLDSTRRPLAMTIARLDPQKGLDHLIAAAEQLPDVVFAVAGDGPERERLQAKIDQRGMTGRFRLLGHREDVPELLAACDVFVLPSLFEGLPVSVLEAMAARKPVVATAVPGTEEAVLNDRTGLLVPPADSKALAAAIRRVACDAGLAERLAGAGRARVDMFAHRAMVSAIERVYEEAR